MDLCKERFEKAKQQRDIIIFNSIKMHRYKTYDAPEVTIQKNVYKLAEQEEVNYKAGLDYEQSWQKYVTANNAELDKQVELEKSKRMEPTKQMPKDGKDWSLSTDEYDIYVSGENKEVVNKDESSDLKMYGSEFINPQAPGSSTWADLGYDIDSLNQKNIAENDDDMEDEGDCDSPMEGDDDDESDKEETPEKPDYSKLENLADMKLEDFEGRPDKISKVTISDISSNSVTLKWDIPDCNNNEISQYIIKCKEFDEVNFESTFKSIYKSETNSVTIEDLRDDCWHIIDVRAENVHGYCPQTSDLLGFKTMAERSGTLYSWGNNEQMELLLSVEDASNLKICKDNSVIVPQQIKSVND